MKHFAVSISKFLNQAHVGHRPVCVPGFLKWLLFLTCVCARVFVCMCVCLRAHAINASISYSRCINLLNKCYNFLLALVVDIIDRHGLLLRHCIKPVYTRVKFVCVALCPLVTSPCSHYFSSLYSQITRFTF